MLQLQKSVSVMESDTISKNEASPKSHTSRENFLLKTLTKTFLILLFVTIFSEGYAHAQLQLGVRAGANFTDMLFFVPSGSASIGTKMKPGFQAGVVFERLDNGRYENLSVQTGLMLAQKSCKIDEGSFLNSSSGSLNLTYIQVPMIFLYKLDLNGPKFLLQGSVPINFAVAGKIIEERGGEKEENKIKFGKNSMSRFETGLGLGAGFQFGHIQAVLDYTITYNVSGNNDIIMFNKGFAFNITYLF